MLQAQAQLGQLRVEAHRIKTSLETTISQHKEALKEAKAIEKQIQVGHSPSLPQGLRPFWTGDQHFDMYLDNITLIITLI